MPNNISMWVGAGVAALVVSISVYVVVIVPEQADTTPPAEMSCAEIARTVVLTKDSDPALVDAIERRCPRMAPDRFKPSINKGY